VSPPRTDAAKDPVGRKVMPSATVKAWRCIVAAAAFGLREEVQNRLDQARRLSFVAAPADRLASTSGIMHRFGRSVTLCFGIGFWFLSAID
jgi:hypothetical protein